MRSADLYKAPGVAERLDWAAALVVLDQVALEPSIVEETLGAILKYQDDIEKVKQQHLRAILERVELRE